MTKTLGAISLIALHERERLNFQSNQICTSMGLLAVYKSFTRMQMTASCRMYAEISI
jgi:hypothetical protein